MEIVSTVGQSATLMNMAGATIQGAIGFDSESGDVRLKALASLPNALPLN